MGEIMLMVLGVGSIMVGYVVSKVLGAARRATNYVYSLDSVSKVTNYTGEKKKSVFLKVQEWRYEGEARVLNKSGKFRKMYEESRYDIQ